MQRVSATAGAVALAVSLVVAEAGGGAIAAFPPPHTFFWAREVEVNVGVLIPEHRYSGARAAMTLTADVRWTFPLEFVEVVTGDGVKTTTKIVPASDLRAFGTRRFTIPFDATGQKWVRFAAWDTAGNGALTMPIRLPVR
jgi:hypothetical protein